MIQLEQIDVKLYDQGTTASETDRQTDRWTVGRLNIAYHALQSNRAVKTIVMHNKLISAGNAMVLGGHRSEAQTH